MYGWAITCSETSSSLGVCHTGLSPVAGLVVAALFDGFYASTAIFISLMFPPFGQTQATGNNCHLFASA